MNRYQKAVMREMKLLEKIFGTISHYDFRYARYVARCSLKDWKRLAMNEADKKPKCPYYINKTPDYIRCRRGHYKRTFEETKIEAKYNKFCCNKYTECPSYKNLQKAW